MASLYQRGSAALPSRLDISSCTSCVDAGFALVDKYPQRRKCHIQGKRLSVNGKRNALHAAEVSLAAATVQRRVAIQQFLPETLSWDAHTVVLANDRRKITHEEQLLLRTSTAPQEIYDAPLIIVTVDPCKTSGIEVQFIQRWLTAIKGVQVAHPPLQCRVKGRIQQMPVEACIVIPFRPLAEFTAHE